MSWFAKVNVFKKEIKDTIDKMEKHIEYKESIQLNEVIGNLSKIVHQIRSWALVISNLKTFLSHLQAEYDEYYADLFLTSKTAMVLEQDDRKQKKLKVYSFTNEEIKYKCKLDRKIKAMNKKLREVNNLIDHVESVHYWTSVNTIDVLKEMSKFSIAREKDYKI